MNENEEDYHVVMLKYATFGAKPRVNISELMKIIGIITTKHLEISLRTIILSYIDINT